MSRLIYIQMHQDKPPVVNIHLPLINSAYRPICRKQCNWETIAGQCCCNLKMKPGIELRSITLKTLSQEVVVGLIGITIMNHS